jgi:hypothetical protein
MGVRRVPGFAVTALKAPGDKDRPTPGDDRPLEDCRRGGIIIYDGNEQASWEGGIAKELKDEDDTVKDDRYGHEGKA